MIIGLTGGIGSGKSTVAELFQKHGVTVIDADQLSHQLCEPGEEGYHAIVEHFGASILNALGQIDRTKLRTLVFNDTSERDWLEATLHPMIRRCMRDAAKKITTKTYCILMIPLLTESNNFDDIDRILVVDCPEALQIERAMHRDNSSMDDIKKIMDAQNSRDERLSYADDVIVNDSDLHALELQVDALCQCYNNLHSITQ